ncbi:hypothetical protein Sp245p_25940 (plasmid) [Azospirillum baldaniorum]|uniref:Uncharacterized protein n=1 Tax=Azospirillum baldaniorum TaxID=1064539 RepID=A0A9P1JZU5_9PROT|nr:hypothetical protein [Azospirillum baldaniorum]AWJ93268.1 hypothetical protein Sp245p_25940 [Azospirillum baldaniorum]TWA77962.1 hypothetical protein FBZ85_106122 [Azospirillum brasilense]CCD02938.1 protein of unknown function [Azospirillum baldaniorum]
MLNSTAPRESWLSYPYWIATDRGPQPVTSGKARGPFAVHRDHDGWRLTHLPTGALIGLADDAETAMAVSDLIAGIRNWSLPQEPTAIEKDVASAMLRSRGIRAPETRKYWAPSAIAPAALPLGT